MEIINFTLRVWNKDDSVSPFKCRIQCFKKTGNREGAGNCQSLNFFYKVIFHAFIIMHFYHSMPSLVIIGKLFTILKISLI